MGPGIGLSCTLPAEWAASLLLLALIADGETWTWPSAVGDRVSSGPDTAQFSEDGADELHIVVAGA
ncbi:hypothetical protein [Mycobacterium lepromatosis]|uniref:hypothetical protein n=1 Tax=Mycobacterium lepromatosis TaxID=480418 RepID=UPI001F375AEE|nr:hypothetical protein [Mycobacterium lepromatosis]